MKINCFITNEKSPKITTYHIMMNAKSILLDYGVELKNQEFIKRIDYIFISHEHGDHIAGLINEYKYLNNNVKIYMTNTCKEILLTRTDVDFGQFLKEHVVELYFDEPTMESDIEITLFQAGHTFGSACIYLRGEYSIIYTGDINYAKFDELCSYNIPYSLETDYLILDGTSLSKEHDFKKTSITHLKKEIANIEKFYINVKPEKAVYIGKYLSKTYDNVVYEPDLKDYLGVLIDAGYEPFYNDKIGYDMEDIYKKNPGVFISSTKFSNFNKDNSISLHISRDDIKDLLDKFKNIGKVLIGHYYDLDNDYGFTILKEGSNEV